MEVKLSSPADESRIEPAIEHHSACGSMRMLYVEAVISIDQIAPAKGVPKEADTPAAAAAPRTSSRLASLVASEPKHERLRMRISATAHAMWMLGPSWPTLRPAANARTSPTSLVQSARIVKSDGLSTPWSTTLTSGTPEPAAVGHHTWHARHPASAQRHENATYDPRRTVPGPPMMLRRTNLSALRSESVRAAMSADRMPVIASSTATRDCTEQRWTTTTTTTTGAAGTVLHVDFDCHAAAGTA
mmetsp:Transcript_26490/g.106047  ORF Transcript_26490/g.106047 Transcript_26490/m.106047 type:complete len:245 (+) Transcript_26490:1869-2603(+)